MTGRIVERILAKPALLVGLMGALGVALAAMLAGWIRIPVPRVHDEFGYLLQADTFRHGRLTNPTHPMWQHFESFHIIHQPTYTARYPAGQGMLLALGWWLGGAPIIGVWLGVGFACAAVTWAMLGWVRPRWAMLGGLLTLIHPAVLDWGQRYLCATLPIAGGALVIGAWRRLADRPRLGSALAMGAGMFVLAHTRPYEGVVLSVIAGVGLVTWWIWSRQSAWWRAAIPVGVMAGLSVASVGYYSWRVTGDAFRPPWAHYHEQYGVVPIFLWQPARTIVPEYRHWPMADFHLRWEVNQYQEQRTLPGFVRITLIKLRVYLTAWFSQVVVAVCFVAALAGWRRNPWVRWLMLALLFYLVAVVLVVGVQPYYVAAAYPVVLILALTGWRRLHADRRGRPVIRLLLLLSALYLIPWSVARANRQPSWAEQRAQVQDQLIEKGGKHLVIVRYSPKHFIHFDWVFNEADIDSAAVVWARDMAGTANEELIKYYKDRQIWLLEADEQPPRLQAVDPAAVFH